MNTSTSAPLYKGFRFPPEIISHGVWLSFRFSLSFRDVEELLAQRGIFVTYETGRQWCLTFGQMYANELRRHRPRCGDKWHMDEMVLTIHGKRHNLFPGPLPAMERGGWSQADCITISLPQYFTAWPYVSSL